MEFVEEGDAARITKEVCQLWTAVGKDAWNDGKC